MHERCKFLKTSVLTLIKALGVFIKRYWFIIFTLFTTALVGLIMVIKISTIIKILIVGIYFLIFTILYYIYKTYKMVKNKKVTDFPIMPKRYTKKMYDMEMVYVEENKWHEAIIYLSMVEDYLENRGYYL